MTTPLALVGALALLAGLAVAGLVLATPRGPLRRAGRDYLAWLGPQLEAQRASLGARGVLALQLLGTAALLVGGAALSSYLWLAVPLPFALTRTALRAAERRRVATIEQQLGGWLIALANVLKVSGSVADALAQTLELTRAPLVDELDRTVKEIRLGASVDGALRELARRIDSPMLAAAVTALVIGRRTGGALPSLLTETAKASRERLRLDRVFRQHLAAVRLQFVALALGPPLLVGGLDRMQPGFFDPLLDSPFGMLILVGAGALWLVAVLVARRIMGSVV